jgi:Surface-adhesin protein E
MNSIRSMTASLAVVVALTTSVNIQAQSAPTLATSLAEPGTSNTATKQQQDEVITTVDWKSFDRLGNHARIWLLRSFTETTLLGHELYPHRSQRIQYVIDCTDRSYALSQWVLTDGENGAGQVVWADRNSALSFVEAAKDTIEAGVVHAACSMEPTRVAEHQVRFLLDPSSPLSN